jgi:glycosyltransferase involved in cell wall biosynthesis
MDTQSEVTLSILMPCLNEVRTLGACIAKAKCYLARQNFAGEIVIADNGSTDGSQQLAESMGARVVSVSQRGYGNALKAGIIAARGKYIIMGDSDDSYDFESLDDFVEKLQAGYDLVCGNRFRGGIRRGAMPPLHRYFGNPLLTMLGRLLFKSPIHDFYCGLRGFRRDAILALELHSPGMEFALEMVVKSTLRNLRITEVPTILFPDGRDRPPHLRSWRDGWRSLRFYLLLSPEGLFLYPGLALTFLSGIISVVLFFTNIKLGSIAFAQHTLIITCSLTALGIQSVFFWTFAKSLAIQSQLLLPDQVFKIVRGLFNLEKCLLTGSLLVLSGFGVATYGLLYWYDLSFGRVEGDTLIRIVCAASFLICIGFQLIFSAFFLLLLEQKATPAASAPGAQLSWRPTAHRLKSEN